MDCQVGFAMPILSIIWHLALVCLGLVRDGGIPQGCPLSMMFIVALYLPWCRYLSAQVGVQPQLYADILKCLSRSPDLLLHSAKLTTKYVRLVGQEPTPSKCALLSTSRVVRKDMKGWVLSQEGDLWSVKFDVRDLGGHPDTTFRGWSSTLAARVRLVISRLVPIFVSLSSIVSGLLLGWVSLMDGLGLGFLFLFSVLGVGRLRLGKLMLLILRRFLLVLLTLMFISL